MYCTTLLLAVSMVAGQAEAQKTFDELADLLVGGTWVYQGDDGTIAEHSYHRILDGKYLKSTATAIAGGSPAIAIVGIDPSVGKVNPSAAKKYDVGANATGLPRGFLRSSLQMTVPH